MSYMDDHTGCHQTVFWLQNNVSEKCQPTNPSDRQGRRDHQGPPGAVRRAHHDRPELPRRWGCHFITGCHFSPRYFCAVVKTTPIDDREYSPPCDQSVTPGSGSDNPLVMKTPNGESQYIWGHVSNRATPGSEPKTLTPHFFFRFLMQPLHDGVPRKISISGPAGCVEIASKLVVGRCRLNQVDP
jgi:hypothetical protein